MMCVGLSKNNIMYLLTMLINLQFPLPGLLVTKTFFKIYINISKSICAVD